MQLLNNPVNGFVTSQIYDTRDLDDDVLRRASYGVYISQLIRFESAIIMVTL